MIIYACSIILFPHKNLHAKATFDVASNTGSYKREPGFEAVFDQKRVKYLEVLINVYLYKPTITNAKINILT